MSQETSRGKLGIEIEQAHSIILQPSRQLMAHSIAQNATVVQMIATSLTLARTAALESDDLDALVGQALRIQDGVPVMAFRLFHRAATAGHAEAQFQLFRCYWSGRGVEQDRVNSLESLRRAAESGFAPAQNELGCHCLLSDKLTEAVKWFGKSAQQGDAYGQWSLGCCYADGKGVPQDHAEAVKLFRKGAKQNLAWAQNELGFCYLVGQGVSQNLFQALKWYRLAAAAGNAGGQYALGRCYQMGQGLLQDTVQAYKWLRLAADQDHERAKEEVTGLAAQMSPSDLQAARSFYEEFKIKQNSPLTGTSVDEQTRPFSAMWNDKDTVQ